MIELLVAVAIFAAVAAIAYGGLATVAQTRQTLAAEQDRFAALTRAMSDVSRDLRHAIARPVRGNYGEMVPTLRGSSDALELSRLGFANPLAEPRSNVERVIYALADHKLRRGRYAVLDRAPGTVPANRDLIDRVVRLRWRYLDRQGKWSDQWPSTAIAPNTQAAQAVPRDQDLPRAVEMTLELEDYGELRRIVALPSALPSAAPRAVGPPPSEQTSPINAPPSFGFPLPAGGQP